MPKVRAYETSSNWFVACSTKRSDGCGWRSNWRPKRPEDRAGDCCLDEWRILFFLGQDSAQIERRSTGYARTIAAALRGDGTSRGQSQFASAKIVRNSAGRAKRVRNRPQSKARFSGSNSRLAGIAKRR